MYIRPPGDILADSIRKVVEMNNISNAAILFDDTFGMLTLTFSSSLHLLMVALLSDGPEVPELAAERARPPPDQQDEV